MLYKDWDVIIYGTRIRITPMTMEDEPEFGRLMLGDLYDRMVEDLGSVATGINGIINHTEKEETHAIRLLDDESFIGWITLQRDPEGRPDIGISLLEKYRNQGIGPDTVRLFANRLYKEYGIERVFIRISELNLQSQRAFAKLGAVLDKREPDYRMKRIVDQLPEEQYEKVNDLLFYHIKLPC